MMLFGEHSQNNTLRDSVLKNCLLQSIKSTHTNKPTNLAWWSRGVSSFEQGALGAVLQGKQSVWPGLSLRNDLVISV